MRKKVKIATAMCMVVLLVSCQPAVSSPPEETLPVETESQENQQGDMAESTSEATTALEATEQTTKQKSNTVETTEWETSKPFSTSEAGQEVMTESHWNKKDSETQKEPAPAQRDGQPEDALQEKEESEKAEEPAPQPTDTAEKQPEPATPIPEAPKTEAPQPEAPKPQPEPKPEPEPEPQPEPEPAPAETQPKTCYDYPFDTEAIRGELIGIGQGAGLTHVEKTPDNSSWAAPVTASESFQGEALKRSLADYVSSMPALAEMYGGNPLTEFCIYVEDIGGGSYTFYFLY